MAGRHVAEATDTAKYLEAKAMLHTDWPEFAPEHHEGAHVAPAPEEDDL